jgi:hypothetical protein
LQKSKLKLKLPKTFNLCTTNKHISVSSCATCLNGTPVEKPDTAQETEQPRPAVFYQEAEVQTDPVTFETKLEKKPEKKVKEEPKIAVQTVQPKEEAPKPQIPRDRDGEVQILLMSILPFAFLLGLIVIWPYRMLIGRGAPSKSSNKANGPQRADNLKKAE